MSKTFDGIIDYLCKKTGYEYNFLVDKFNEVMEEDGDIQYFIGVTMEKDW